MIECREIHTNCLFVFGGAYGNLAATKAVLAKARSIGFMPAEILFTGDMVAYCANPQETVDLIRGSGINIIAGNCETSLAAGSDDCGCGFEAGSACSILSNEWYRYCQRKLSPDTISWMQSLPTGNTVSIGNHKLLACHGTPESINQFVFPSDISENKYNLQHLEEFDGVICGHSGIPFVSETGGKVWVNSGASGMPANDGTPRIWYAVLEATGSQLRIETSALDYEFEVAADAMTQSGLDNGYRDCLRSGIWPSHDVLPNAERAITGQAIEPQVLMFEKETFSAVA